jgi:putative endonuclease
MTKTDRIRRYKDGLWAETLSAWYLRCKGYRILRQRYKTPMGEIDIIARRGKVVAFIEVKRRGSYEDAVISVTPRTQSRIVRAAQMFMAQQDGLQNCDLRFDVIAVLPFRLRHLDNAWRPPA